MDGWMEGWTDGRMNGWMDGWMDAGPSVTQYIVLLLYDGGIKCSLPGQQTA